MNDPHGYRSILRSTSVMALASITNMAVGFLRVKAVALLLGPAGVGLLGLLGNLVAIASTVSAVGVASAGTRQVADAVRRNDPTALARVRRSLLWGALVMAAAGTAVFWLLRCWLSGQVLRDQVGPYAVGWLALAAGLTVIGFFQGALLNGLRRIGDLARISVGAAVASTAVGVAAIYWLGSDGIVVYLLAVPLLTVVLSHGHIARLPAPAGAVAISPGEVVGECRRLMVMGVALMLAGLLAILCQLAIRTLVYQRLGTHSLGLFEASWIISVTYIGFVLNAMGTDYLPRLTSTIHDNDQLNALVNRQTRLALLITGPIFFGVLGAAPWLLRLLYSADFVEASAILRWQVMGDMLKVLSWPLGFVLLARGDMRLFLWLEIVGYGVFLAATWLGLGPAGVVAVGIGFVGMYVLYLPLVHWVARRRVGFAWTRQNLLHGGLMLAGGLCVNLVALQSELQAAYLGMAGALAGGIYAVRQLAGGFSGRAVSPRE